MTIEPKTLEFSCTSDDFKVAVRGYGVKVEIDPDGTRLENHLDLLPPDGVERARLETIIQRRLIS